MTSKTLVSPTWVPSVERKSVRRRPWLVASSAACTPRDELVGQRVAACCALTDERLREGVSRRACIAFRRRVRGSRRRRSSRSRMTSWPQRSPGEPSPLRNHPWDAGVRRHCRTPFAAELTGYDFSDQVAGSFVLTNRGPSRLFAQAKERQHAREPFGKANPRWSSAEDVMSQRRVREGLVVRMRRPDWHR